MPIIFNEQTKTFRLDAKDASYAFRINELGYLQHLYYGAHISDTDLTVLTYVPGHAALHIRPAENKDNQSSLDLIEMEYPCFGRGDCRGTALSIRRSDTGTLDTDLRYVSHKIYAGKLGISGQPATFANDEDADTLEILCRDTVSGAEVTLYYTAFRDLAAFSRRASIKNAGENILEIERALSLCADFHDVRDMDVIHLWGDWAKERSVERVPMMHGTQSVGSLRGASSAMHNPFLALCDRHTTETAGDAYGFNLVYTGNFLASAEMDSDGCGRILLGIHPDGFRWKLEPSETFETPEAIMVYSAEGLGAMSRTFHRLYHDHLIRGKWRTERRPILINNWEATYFKFDEEKIFGIAEEAAKLGIEMLVLDDGWFGKRDTDRSGLGDWFVNETKLKGGLQALVNRIHGLGMKFGIWFEPEMVSPDSDLYRAHPDWAMQVPGRPLSIGRNQYVLDMTRTDVRDYLFTCISDILSQGGIDYVKWDFNRNFSEVGSLTVGTDRQGEVFHRYCLGLYDLLERLHVAFPDVLLEGCSSGGGRFDPAWLYYAPQIWTSDDTDAIERLDIQYGTSFCYPPSSMGAHVSACPNHQVGRTEPIKTRGDVALMGAFGYELDLRTLTDEEKETVRAQCESFRRDYALTHDGDFYRLRSPWQDRTDCAWGFVSRDKTAALVTYTLVRAKLGMSPSIRLQGLDPDFRYRCTETGEEFCGDTLMRAGYRLKHANKDSLSYHLHFVKI